MLQSRHAYNQGRRCESARNRICGTNAPATLPQLECQLISNRQVLAERSVGREGGREEVNRADATRGRRNLVRRTIGHRLPSATVFFQLLVIGVYLLRLLIANTARRCVTPPISLPPPFPIHIESIVRVVFAYKNSGRKYFESIESTKFNRSKKRR